MGYLATLAIGLLALAALVPLLMGAIGLTGDSGMALNAMSGEDLTAAFAAGAALALGVGLAKTAVAFVAAVALALFAPPLRRLWLLALALCLAVPIGLRLEATLGVTAGFGQIEPWARLAAPLIAPSLATLALYRFLRDLPGDMLDAARLDGAGPWRLVGDFALPMARPALAAIFALTVVDSWNQYAWPLAIPDMPPSLTPLTALAAAEGPAVSGLALMVLAPPVLFMLAASRALWRGMADLAATGR